jgi:hypothetical protein
MSFHEENAEMKCFFLADLKKGKFIFSCPNNIYATTVSDVNSIFYSLRESASKSKTTQGKINSIDGFYNYFVVFSRILVIVSTNTIYKDYILKEFVDKIFENGFDLVENFEIKLKELKFRERIYKIFELYKFYKSYDDINKKTLDDIDVSNYFFENEIHKSFKTFYNSNASNMRVKFFFILNESRKPQTKQTKLKKIIKYLKRI